MPYFECIKTHTEATVVERTQMRKRDDTVTVVESLRVVDIKPGAYGYENIEVGKVYEINGKFARKAKNNIEYFKEVDKPKRLSKATRAKRTPPEVVDQIKENIRALA